MRAQLGNTQRRRLSLLGATALGLLMAATVLPAAGQAPSEPDLDGVSFSFQGEDGDRVASDDAREGSVAPTAAQEAAAEAIGATAARWNRFGTPKVLFNRDGYLSGPRAGDAADVARGFVLDHRDLFRHVGGLRGRPRRRDRLPAPRQPRPGPRPRRQAGRQPRRRPRGDLPPDLRRPRRRLGRTADRRRAAGRARRLGLLLGDRRRHRLRHPVAGRDRRHRRGRRGRRARPRHPGAGRGLRPLDHVLLVALARPPAGQADGDADTD